MGLIILATGCDKEDAWDMLKKRGESVTQYMDLEDFHSIVVDNGFNVILRQGDHYSAILDGWKNLMPKIRLTVDKEGVLTMEDTNGFNFVRHGGNMTTVYLSFPGDLTNIQFSGNGNIITEGMLNVSSLFILCSGASGSVDLTIKTPNVNIGTDVENTASLTIRGSCDDLGMTNWGYGPIDLSGLEALQANMHHRGTGNVYVNASDILSVVLYAVGDMYYKGTPLVTLTRQGKGNLYKME